MVISDEGQSGVLFFLLRLLYSVPTNMYNSGEFIATVAGPVRAPEAYVAWTMYY